MYLGWDTDQVRILRLSGQGQGHSSKTARNSIFTQCKTPMEDWAVKFACSMGFSVMAYWMVWAPSLSR